MVSNELVLRRPLANSRARADVERPIRRQRLALTHRRRSFRFHGARLPEGRRTSSSSPLARNSEKLIGRSCCSSGTAI